MLHPPAHQKIHAGASVPDRESSATHKAGETCRCAVVFVALVVAVLAQVSSPRRVGARLDHPARSAIGRSAGRGTGPVCTAEASASAAAARRGHARRGMDAAAAARCRVNAGRMARPARGKRRVRGPEPNAAMSGAPTKSRTGRRYVCEMRLCRARASLAWISSCNRSNAQFLSVRERQAWATGPSIRAELTSSRLVPPCADEALSEWSQLCRPRGARRETSRRAPACGRKNHRQRHPRQHHGRAADRSGEGKNALAGEDMHRKLGGKQDRARLHDEADNKSARAEAVAMRACAAMASAAAACKRRNSAPLSASSPPFAWTPAAAIATPAAPISAATPARMRGERVIPGSIADNINRRGPKQSLGPALVKTIATRDSVARACVADPN